MTSYSSRFHSDPRRRFRDSLLTKSRRHKTICLLGGGDKSCCIPVTAMVFHMQTDLQRSNASEQRFFYIYGAIDEQQSLHFMSLASTLLWSKGNLQVLYNRTGFPSEVQKKNAKSNLLCSFKPSVWESQTSAASEVEWALRSEPWRSVSIEMQGCSPMTGCLRMLHGGWCLVALQPIKPHACYL